MTTGITTVISGIFLPPTLAADKSEVKRGDVITFFGATVPSATVTLVVNSEQEITKTTAAKADGSFTYQFDSLELNFGQHSAKSRSATADELTNFSSPVAFTVGNRNVLATAQPSCGIADVNCDGKVNLVDYSIVAYWYGRNTPPVIVDLKKDGVVNLIDFSILAFYWTG